MTTNRETLWNISELGSQVALALAENYHGQTNGSVRHVPDLRTIRYYTARRLLDRPVEMRGRTALYGKRHLLQLVAIKRLQVKGLTLLEIQQRLLGASDSALQKIAQLPAGFSFAPAEPEQTPEESKSRSETFWREAPADFVPTEKRAEQESIAGSETKLMQGIHLDEEVTLLLSVSRLLEEDDLEAIRVAAGPLLKFLQKRRLIRSSPERRTS